MHTSRQVPIKLQMSTQLQSIRKGTHIQRLLVHHCWLIVSHVSQGEQASRTVNLTFGMLVETAYQQILVSAGEKQIVAVSTVTHTTMPSQVIRIVQLNPSIDISPKFRWF